MKRASGNILIVILVLAIVAGLGIAGFFVWRNKNQIKPVTPAAPLTWEECIKQPGAIVQQSYPGVCRLPDGRSVVQPLSEDGKKNLQPPSGATSSGSVDQNQESPQVPQPGNNRFVCPANGWVDCMPILTPEKKLACSQEAMAWYKANCPNFQGGAQ